jgi:serine/threonine-protein kinase
VNEKSILKIADFGLASATNDSGVTMKSTILGTPSYMSPEQITGGEISFQSDLFSVGIVAFEMYTGINPFAKNDINSTINYILNYDELALDGINSIPEDVRDIIAKLLKKNKAKRSKTCIEALAEMNVPVEEIRNKEVRMSL